ncbi:uncharacterized protein LOC110109847 [Dendrobium catenatum]|uniref:uncharacterized protein LOC110109847 n=1 Tax=Dendrobium catenatum TaxID=906689 RepID=UPI00109F6942|nr:uncharacterized protein LOC110109847 [Dendrobium catenatum]
MTSPPSFAAWNTRGFNSPDKTLCCKDLVKKFNLDLLFILETRISLANSTNNWFLSTHSIFPHEGSYDNFNCASPGRIWIKWNSLKVTFKPLVTSSQLIHGLIFSNLNNNFYVTVVYAANSMEDRKALWKDIYDIANSISMPWIILGDFNCCRHSNEKAGGSLLHNSKIMDFHNFIFKTGVHDLSSVGHFFTWYNQRADNPIHIKLDRMLVNDAWLDSYPNSFYIVEDPLISDHSPIILQQEATPLNKRRFQFKNYWTLNPDFWNELISIFSQRYHSSPIHSFYQKLKTLKLIIKSKTWSSSNSIKRDIDELTQSQSSIISQLQTCPLDQDLNLALTDINHKLAERNANWTDWIIQRAKAKWLSSGEDDLKFLYSRINVRHNINLIKVISTNSGTFSSKSEISNAIIQHF